MDGKGVDTGGPGGNGVGSGGKGGNDAACEGEDFTEIGGQFCSGGNAGMRHPGGGLPRQSSAANLNMSGVSERFRVDVSRVNALKASVDRHTDAIYKLLMGSKEYQDKRMQIESAFRVCRDAFMEVSAVMINLMEERSANISTLTVEDVKNVVDEALEDLRNDKLSEKHNSEIVDKDMSRVRSYATVAASAAPEVRVAGGPTVGVMSTTSFIVVPDRESKDRFRSSQDTRNALFRALKPADCGLKVGRIASVRNNGVRIDAFSPDIEGIKAHAGLAKVGLRVQESIKLNPRLIVHGIPLGMSPDEIEDELIAQNLDKNDDPEIKVVYIYPVKRDRRTVSCVLEVSSAVRNVLLKSGRIFLRYSACSFSDYVRIVQCYRCLAFGHIAKECKSGPCCGHCAEAHEKKDCMNCDKPPVCHNCLQYQNSKDSANHSATDAKRCPILDRKIKEKIANINYE